MTTERRRTPNQIVDRLSEIVDEAQRLQYELEAWSAELDKEEGK